MEKFQTENVEGKWWQSNLECLAEYRPDLLKLVENVEWQPVGSFFQTVSGDLSIKLIDPHEPTRAVAAYGSENPWADVAIHLETVPVGSHGLAIFIGMGLGYGPLLIMRERPTFSKMAIFEPSLGYFCAALQAVDLRPLIMSDRVIFYVGEINYQKIEGDLGRQVMLEEIHILRHVPGFTWQPEMYESVDHQAFSVLNELNVLGATTVQHGEDFFRNRLENLTLLRNSHNLDILQNSFKNKPAVLVAAGPSLDQSMIDLKKVKGKCVLIAVDSALIPLLENGIVPDFVTTLDFQELNFEKMAPCLGQDRPFFLVSNIKATPLTAKRFPARDLFFGFPDDKPHLWMAKSLGVKQFLPPMSSVANMSLGLALHVGAGPIFFVGQDLAFTSQENDHVEGAVFHSEDPGGDNEIQYVDGVNGGKVATARNLMALQKQFEDVISSSPGDFWNCSAAGVQLKGAPAISLSEAAERFMEEPVALLQAVDEALESGNDFTVQPFLQEAANVRGKIAAINKQLKIALPLSKNSIAFLENNAQQLASVQSFEDFPEKIKQKMRRMDKINGLLDKDDVFWDQILELTFDKLKDNDRNAHKSESILKEEGYPAWMLAELKRIEAVNKARFNALQVYGKKLGAVVSHLTKEKKLLAAVRSKGEFKARLALARLYNESGDLNLARKVLEDCAAGAGDERFDLLQGEVSAGLLDYENAWRCWQEYAVRGSGACSYIDEAIDGLMAPWLDGIEKVGEKHGNNPVLLATLFARIDKLLMPDKPLPVRLIEVWQVNKKDISELLDAQNVEKAMKAITPWLLLSSRLPEISFLYARLLYAKDDFSQAIQQLSEALDRKPEMAEWLAFLARVLLESGQFDLGLAKLQEAVRLDPKYGSIWEELGDALMVEGDYGNAIIAYESCFQSLPECIPALMKMGDAYLQNRQLDAAVATYRAVCAKDPGNAEVKKRLAVLKK